jgi:formamidopyrimidine-DNA glycosylase
MPELPEVETMRRQLAPVVGAEIAAVRRPRVPLRSITFRPSLAAIRRRLPGRKIVRLDRLGKRLAFWLEGRNPSPLVLLIEPRMTGCVTFVPLPDRKHIRLVLELKGAPVPAVYFWDVRGLGVVELATPEEWTQLTRRIGPDALLVSARHLQDRLCRAKRPIKTALMDQAVLAGIGNLYASEILFVAGIHPETPCSDLEQAYWRRLCRAMRRVLRRAIEAQGSTLADGTYRTIEGEPGFYQYDHYVYQRTGEACRRCKSGQIRRITQAGRSTFFCPVCQSNRAGAGNVR